MLTLLQFNQKDNLNLAILGLLPLPSFKIPSLGSLSTISSHSINQIMAKSLIAINQRLCFAKLFNFVVTTTVVTAIIVA